MGKCQWQSSLVSSSSRLRWTRNAAFFKIHRARIQIFHQVVERSYLVHWLRFHGVRVKHGLAHIAQRRVHGMRQSVDGCALLLARDHQAGAFMILQIAHYRCDPFVGWRRRTLAPTGIRAQRRRQAPGELLHVGGPQGHAVIGFRARGSGHRLDHVQPVHFHLLAAYPATSRKLPRVSQAGRSRCQEIGVQRHYHVRAGQVVNRVDRLPKCETRSCR
jgi:hypothetical protein